MIQLIWKRLSFGLTGYRYQAENDTIVVNTYLYNTLDTIRIQAQLNGDKKVADLLMRLVDFFRLSVKIDQQLVALDDELELLEAYMELMCYRYPELQCDYDIDPELGGIQVPNFILQPIVENGLLHGLKNKGYRGEIRISAQKTADDNMEIQVIDTGSGFAEGKKLWLTKCCGIMSDRNLN